MVRSRANVRRLEPWPGVLRPSFETRPEPAIGPAQAGRARWALLKMRPKSANPAVPGIFAPVIGILPAGYLIDLTP